MCVVCEMRSMQQECCSLTLIRCLIIGGILAMSYIRYARPYLWCITISRRLYNLYCIYINNSTYNANDIFVKNIIKICIIFMHYYFNLLLGTGGYHILSYTNTSYISNNDTDSCKRRYCGRLYF